ncbi:MAG: preprotein translocase subunit SecG [Bacteroidales bacterium]|nr:preprotein translocase subunit SecG [Bacteroidales bacterium]
MYTFIVILILIVCALLALVVLVQNSKGGGLAANFQAPTQVMGVRQAADFMEKATWWLAGILVVLSLAATASIPSRSGDDAIRTEVTSNDNPVQDASPIATPVQTPDQQ